MSEPQILDAPDGAGDYYIDGRAAVCRVIYSHLKAGWMYCDGFGWEQLGGLRVARVPPSPFLPTATKKPESTD